MRKSGVMWSVAAVAILGSGFNSDKTNVTTDEEEIQAVITSAYIEGVHLNRDTEAIRAGFHPEFVMTILDDGGVINATLDQWVERIAASSPQEHEIEWEFENVDVTGSAAVVKLAVFEDGTQIYTDYMGLYKFDSGWKIVNKIFYSH